MNSNLRKIETKLSRSPLLVQLTTHINNLLIYDDNKMAIKIFKKITLHKNGDYPLNYNCNVQRRVVWLTNYYGLVVIREFFTLIYGWNYDEKVG